MWLAFADHSSDAGSPGWALRNALLLAAARWGLGTLRVAAVRLRRGLACTERSLALTVRLPAVPAGPPLSPCAVQQFSRQGWELGVPARSCRGYLRRRVGRGGRGVCGRLGGQRAWKARRAAR